MPFWYLHVCVMCRGGRMSERVQGCKTDTLEGRRRGGHDHTLQGDGSRNDLPPGLARAAGFTVSFPRQSCCPHLTDC